MSQRSQRHQSDASSLLQQLPLSNEEAIADQNEQDQSTSSGPRSIDRATRTRSVLQVSGLPSSYKTPTRSFIHHASHGSQDVRYSSSGVREQTAELSSSFLSDSEMSRPRGSSQSYQDFPPSRSGSVSTVIDNREQTADKSGRRLERPEAIQERSEPVTPDESAAQKEPPQPKRLSALLQDPGSPARSSLAPSRSSRHSDAHINVPEVVISDAEEEDPTPTEESPLLSRNGGYGPTRKKFGTDGTDESALERQSGPGRRAWRGLADITTSARDRVVRTWKITSDPKAWDPQAMLHIALRPVSVLPAVFLGLLLNLLDALSYGIILFPLGEEVFSSMGPDGVSMFYVSCIIAQVVYSTGSIFRGGVGSEMIEVVPFFHKMTYMVMGQMGTSNPAALRATVITSYSMSSILTGIVFFGLGSARLGTLVSFFPHSILTGCIGGVGIFLFVTGIEVSARLDGNLDLEPSTLHTLFQPDTLALWLPPLALAIILLSIKHFYDRPWLVPAFYIGITVIFYIVVAAVPDLNMAKLRGKGWVFDAPDAGVPFYNFYSYYKFELVDWKAIWMTVPTQFALTFFGILHVPINVPNLALVVQEDNVSVNRELIMHGISNTVSGALGSIQNYLVFVNSVLFMNTGGDSRLAGYMLALATFGLWVAGPVVIGYVPVMVVGTLIYMLGIDLAQEALWATYGRLHRLEYFTIVCIAVVMGVYDFVVGIAIGIGLACLVYVVQTSRKTVIRAEFSGSVAESTVRRPSRQRQYLHKVGPQIRIVKLGGYLFFGSIVKVEKKVRAMVDAEAFAAEPIRYLILDFSHVTGIDFSAAEAFSRMNRILHRRAVRMTLAGVSLQSEVGNGLQMVGLFLQDEDAEDSIPAPKVYENLNGALEACENELLVILTDKQKNPASFHLDGAGSTSIDIPANASLPVSASALDGIAGSPRRDLLQRAASDTLNDHRAPDMSRYQNFKQPLPLLLQAFQDLTATKEDFWFRAVPYFIRRDFVRGQVVYSRGDNPDGFYLLQSGILRAEYEMDQGSYHESIVAGTTCGELPFFSETSRTSTVAAEMDCTAWLLTPEKWESMQKKDEDVARELLKVGMKLSAERMNAVTSYVLITAS